MSRLLAQDVQLVFPDCKETNQTQEGGSQEEGQGGPDGMEEEMALLCVATFQKSSADLVFCVCDHLCCRGNQIIFFEIDYGEDAAFEKDRLLDSFYSWATFFCDHLRQKVIKSARQENGFAKH